ncbi:MAG: DNA polymerase III subunit delta' [Anaerolineaceae bacterium]|nr:DNA polymerase III subunit delta' [Anaerolineaceae bacterium]MDD4042797.1 DNA polymerase III subunit delta' [Anaerolineaceae bacterium]MDD4577395.1 DNA polymerase III subunit delta' [Anaerolineaceae bacterium]
MQWNILGHETAIRFLKNHAIPGKTRHAYLITGPEGVGRETLALAFAKALNCQNPPEKGEFCGVCLACRQIDEQRYPDLLILRVNEGSKDLKIDQIREMQQKLALAPYQSPYRMVLIPDFQRATIGASNALLKSLEEPPSKALLILTADARECLLETIASRCEVLRLRPSSVETLERYLVDEKGIAANRAKRLAHLTGGRVGTALSYDQTQDLLDAYDDALTDLGDLLNSRLRERLQFVEKLQKGKGSSREQIAFLIATWLTFWRDVMIRREGADIPLVNIEHEGRVNETAQLIPSRQIKKMLKDHEKALVNLDANLNPRLVIENLILTLPLLQVA